MKRQLAAVVTIMLIAVGVSFVILSGQRVRWPWIHVYEVRAAFTTGQALTPGQGQAVTVAGVKVGEISRVELDDGRAVATLTIERDRLDRVNRDATMLVRPRTPLQDMTIDIDPGTEQAGELSGDDLLGIERTTPSTNLDELLGSLDRDTRDYATSLVGGLGHAINDRGEALRAALRASAPTLRLQRRVTAAVAGRRTELASAITSLRRLTGAVARDDDSVEQLVRAGDVTFSTLAAEDVALRGSLRRLPSTLADTETALRAVTPFARATQPSLDALLPALRRAPSTLRAVDPLATDGLPALRNLNRLSSEARPLAGQLSTAASSLATVTPRLTSAFGVLRYLTNLLAYNPPGSEEGYLYRFAWYLHNQNSFLSGQDGNGPFWRGEVIFSCSAGINTPLLVSILGPALDQLEVCPKNTGT
jgi:phospholipid/cholesterol/gamma-HCH transport system substrate-binding protein